ncbi:MAG: anti-sigma factor [Pirellulaceae bacterium]|nr:anti-sigma factor [Pirellulaceae bacterium]
MSTSPSSLRDYCDDLLVQKAVYGLAPAENQELDSIMDRLHLTDEANFEAVVAALDSGFAGTELAEWDAELPTHLQDQVLTEAADYLDDPSPISNPASRPAKPAATSLVTPRSNMPRSGWSSRERLLGLVTVASLALALLSLSGSLGSIEQPTAPVQVAQTSAQQLASLSAQTDTRRFAWSNPTNDPAVSDLGGEVVWNDAEQKGFMVFEGLQINDPTQNQYQLWIFDTARNDALPVDGGVFDISSTGQVIIPIDSKLSITQAKAFAVTLEEPGGVVQSQRERLPLLAGEI